MPIWSRAVLAWGVCLPVGSGFVVLKDATNMFNYFIAIPAYFVVAAVVLRRLDEAFAGARYHGQQLYPSSARPITSHFSQPALVFMVLLLAFVAQLVYCVNELSVLDHAPSFVKWQQMYQEHPPVWFPEGFFLLYLTIQFVLLFFSIVALLALIEFTVLAHQIFFRRREDYAYRMPDRYMGLGGFRKAVSVGSILVLLVGTNAATYAYNVQPVGPANLVAFWALFVIYVGCLGYIYYVCDRALRWHKAKCERDAEENGDEERLVRLQGNVENGFFSWRLVILPLLSLFVGLAGVVFSFLLSRDAADQTRVYLLDALGSYF